ncbi:MAG: hypothetical protein IMZ46_12200 [Acidobacteria bacterium]|nr:hypothetical protein [Acidobacteriota bacterium]
MRQSFLLRRSLLYYPNRLPAGRRLELATRTIEDVPTALRSPSQHPFVERVIGSMRRECLDDVIVWNEQLVFSWFLLDWTCPVSPPIWNTIWNVNGHTCLKCG